MRVHRGVTFPITETVQHKLNITVYLDRVVAVLNSPLLRQENHNFDAPPIFIPSIAASNNNFIACRCVLFGFQLLLDARCRIISITYLFPHSCTPSISHMIRPSVDMIQHSFQFGSLSKFFLFVTLYYINFNMKKNLTKLRLISH